MSISNQRGNVLLFVISGIAMAAAIGMGMFYMISTSSLGQAFGSGMNRAYYLALAGKDYATANWNNMANWNGIEFALSSTESFHVSYSDSEKKITSTGIVNKDTPFEARKTIKAPPPSSATKHFFESFEDLTKWATGTQVGGFQVTTVGGDKALQVTSAAPAFSSGTWAFLAFNAIGAGVDLTNSWINAGYSLSYDLQVKVNNSQPNYMGGLNFKVAGSGDSREFYGISFLRAKQSWGSDWYNNDNIPSELKPPAIWNTYTTDGSTRYSQPTIVLWKRYWDSGTSQFKFTWLAYKLLASTDYVVDGSNYLINWSNLQVRLIEAYPLDFVSGGPTPLLHNSVVVGGTSGAIARVSGTPIMTSETWPSNTATGTLTLTNKIGTFQTGENLLVGNTTRAVVSGTLGAKTNYIRVYYGDVSSHGTSNNIPTDNNRGDNPRIVSGSSNIVHWPVDNVSDWKAANDYMTLVQWDDINSLGSAAILPSCTPAPCTTTETNAIIKDASILTPNSGTIDYSGIALHATGDTAAYTYFDDFAIQY